jgi:hypothetical protein
MILLSINIKGVGGSHKLASVRRLFLLNCPNIIFFQETLVDESRSRSFLTKLKPSWYSTDVSSVGKSRGLLVAWDPNKFYIKPYICYGGILVIGFNLELKEKLFFLNVYGPCSDRKVFWQKVGDRGILSLKNLIVSGDFNFTLNEGEI